MRNEAARILDHREAQYKARHKKMLDDKNINEIIIEYCTRFMQMPEKAQTGRGQEFYLISTAFRNLAMAMLKQNKGLSIDGMTGVLGFLDTADDYFESFLLETIGKKPERRF